MRANVQDLQEERRLPYLFGGVPDKCQHCWSDEHVPKFCRFGMDGHGQCWPGRQYALTKQYLQRGFMEILTFTPCDLLPLLRGRTLFFSGDSQTQVPWLSLLGFMPLSATCCTLASGLVPGSGIMHAEVWGAYTCVPPLYRLCMPAVDAISI